MLFRTLSAAVYGIDANLIDVEVDIAPYRLEKDNFMTVGLPDAAVRESRERIRAALKNCGFEVPTTKITINLAPADLKKEGSGFDLPMAMGILGAYSALLKPELPDYVFVGELMLDGSVRAVRGALPIAIATRAQDSQPDCAGVERARGRSGERTEGPSRSIAHSSGATHQQR